MPIPWSQVLIHGPKLLEMANSLLDKQRARSPRPVDPQAAESTQIETLTHRLRVLEEAEVAQAEVVKGMAEQNQGLANGLSELSRKISMALWLAGGALVVSVIALVVALSK